LDAPDEERVGDGMGGNDDDGVPLLYVIGDIEMSGLKMEFLLDVVAAGIEIDKEVDGDDCRTCIERDFTT